MTTRQQKDNTANSPKRRKHSLDYLHRCWRWETISSKLSFPKASMRRWDIELCFSLSKPSPCAQECIGLPYLRIQVQVEACNTALILGGVLTKWSHLRVLYSADTHLLVLSPRWLRVTATQWIPRVPWVEGLACHHLHLSCHRWSSKDLWPMLRAFLCIAIHQRLRLIRWHFLEMPITTTTWHQRAQFGTIVTETPRMASVQAPQLSSWTQPHIPQIRGWPAQTQALKIWQFFRIGKNSQMQRIQDKWGSMIDTFECVGVGWKNSQIELGNSNLGKFSAYVCRPRSDCSGVLFIFIHLLIFVRVHLLWRPAQVRDRYNFEFISQWCWNRSNPRASHCRCNVTENIPNVEVNY